MLELFKQYPRYIIFGLVTMFFSAYGQTFLLALFNPGIQAHYQISNETLSLVYSAATLFAALFLPYLGSLIDKQSEIKFGLIIVVVLSLTFGLITYLNAAWTLFISYTLIRVLGQSMLPMTSSTFMARYFGAYRGRALSLTGLGRAVAEGILPVLMSFIIINYSWRHGFWLLSLSLLMIYLPILTGCFFKNRPQQALYPENTQIKINNSVSFTNRELLKDRRFYLLAFANSVLPFCMTGIYFQSQKIGALLDFDLAMWGKSFIGYSVFQISFNFLSGFLVDKLSAKKIVWIVNLPLFFALILLMNLAHPFLLYVVMILFGASVGLASSIRSSFYAEAYGVNSLGVIKSLDGMIMVISTAIAPLYFAYLLRWQSIGWLFSSLILLVGLSLLSYLWLQRLFADELT
jgi:MFS family permease